LPSSAAGVPDDDAARRWRPGEPGLRSENIPDPNCRGRHCVHHIAMHGRVRACCSCRSTGTSCEATTLVSPGKRSAGTCRPTSGSRSTWHAHEPDTIYVVPIQERLGALSARGKLRVYRQPDGGHEWEHSRKFCRNATATSTCCVTRWPSTRLIRAACISARPADRCTHRRRGDSWAPIVRDLRPWCPSKSRRCRDPSRAPGASADAGARRRRGEARRRGQATQRSVLEALEAAIRCCVGRSATTSRNSAERS